MRLVTVTLLAIRCSAAFQDGVVTTLVSAVTINNQKVAAGPVLPVVTRGLPVISQRVCVAIPYLTIPVELPLASSLAICECLLSLSDRVKCRAEKEKIRICIRRNLMFLKCTSVCLAFALCLAVFPT